MPNMTDKIAWLNEKWKKENPLRFIEVDGGIDVNTAKICKQHGANLLVAGSACLKAPDKATFIQNIEN